MNTLGISGLYHDSAAALVQNGKIVAAAQEERFTRKKHDAAFPLLAVAYCLEEAGLRPQDLDYVAWYEHPIRKFRRIVGGYLAAAPGGFERFSRSLPRWAGEHLWMKDYIRRALSLDCPVEYGNHHLSHAASAFFPSGFADAAILTLDAVGEAVTNGVWLGEGDTIEPIAEIRYPHSIGLFYSTMTALCGFRVNDGEYKLMGLAAFGSPRFADVMRDRIIDVRADGSYRLDLGYFAYVAEERMYSDALCALLGAPRDPTAPVGEREADIAASTQLILEEVVVNQARFARSASGSRNLCLAGGVALNCLANSKVARSVDLDRLWIQPAAGDAGGALGAALMSDRRHRRAAGPSAAAPAGDQQQGSYLGPEFPDDVIEAALLKEQIGYAKLPHEELCAKVAVELARGQVVGWFQGRMEFGPRALGNRSILADARDPAMQARLNQVVKHREAFRPFAPIVLEASSDGFFDMPMASPYMLLVGQVRGTSGSAEGSPIPAVTHVDGTARVQTLAAGTNPLMEALLRETEKLSGMPLLVNTSFNDADEPIVCSPEDAIRAFKRTSLDALAIGSFLVVRAGQDLQAVAERHDETQQRESRDRDVGILARAALFAGFWVVVVPLSRVRWILHRAGGGRSTRPSFWKLRRRHPRLRNPAPENVYPLW